MSVITNEVSWSRKRRGALAGCPRAYFYQYYLKWEGWLDSAPLERRLAYRLSRMTDLARLAGIAVHETIRRMIGCAGSRRELATDPEELAAGIMRRTWIDAVHRRWQDRPKQFPPVFELYYQDGVPREEIVRVGAIARRAVRTFAASDVFARIRASNPADWLAVDEPLRFDEEPALRLDDAKVWCRPDFAMREGRFVAIYDWKTGTPKDEDRLQLLAYALHARSQWGFDPPLIRCLAVYLGERAEEVEHAVSASALEETEALIRGDLARIRERDALSRDEEAFPTAPEPARCARCEFQEICPEVRRIPVHRAGTADAGLEQEGRT